MSTNEDKSAKRAVVFEEGPHFRAVASWLLDSEKKLMLDDVELEILGADALGATRWESCGFVVVNGSISGDSARQWLGRTLIARAERWLKENV